MMGVEVTADECSPARGMDKEPSQVKFTCMFMVDFPIDIVYIKFMVLKHDCDSQDFYIGTTWDGMLNPLDRDGRSGLKSPVLCLSLAVGWYKKCILLA